MPDALNLESLRGNGLKPGEVELPDETTPAGPQPDATIVAELLSMGLTESAAKRACLAVQNSGVEAAITWHFEHQDDPGTDDPEPGGGGDGAATVDVDPESVATLASLGFSNQHVTAALKTCGNNAERA